MQVEQTIGVVYRAALYELTKLPRAPKRHIKVARKLIAQADALEEKLIQGSSSYSDDEVIKLEIKAAHHLICAGVTYETIRAIIALVQ